MKKKKKEFRKLKIKKSRVFGKPSNEYEKIE